MGRRPRAAAVSGAMRHEALTYGRAAAARPAGDGVGAAEEGRAASRRGASRPDASRRGAVCGSHVAQNALFRHVAAREAWGATPRQPAGHYGEWPNWANVLEQPPASLRGGLCRGPQASAWGLAARKDAVWIEGLAEGVPRVRPGHHQAPSCGLRGGRELRVRSPARAPLSKGSMGIPSSCLAARQQGIGCSEC